MRKFIGLKTACATLALLAAMAITLPAQTFTTLHSFDGTDGSGPYFAALVQGTDGNFYGTTYTGGASGVGTVFKISRKGTLTTLYSFADYPDGAYPAAGLVEATDGNLYGTTYAGGANGGGMVFKITPGGTLTTLYSFYSQGNGTDGYYPNAGLVQGIDGDFYGTTEFGGVNTCVDYGCGTIFRLTPSGTLTTLYSFCSQSGCADGATPLAGLVQAVNRDLYGTTYYGGTDGAGTVFKITPSGTFTTLYSFCSQSGCTDGATPTAKLVQASNGNLYGTTYKGGSGNLGTVFKITPAGTFTTFYSFGSRSGDGLYPEAPLVQATDGNLYGTTPAGGAHGVGTVFEITLSGEVTTPYSFCAQYGCTDGQAPLAAVVQGTDGSFYGTTYLGGTGACAGGCGTVFSLSTGLGPFVETQPDFGVVGRQVRILGTDLTGATSVTFNGTPATFTVISPSLIGTAVPEGATTGTVQVVTPGGTLSSNVPFRVRQ
jgi:uncharacterized repeat protein (TIGR03803 family)